MKARRGYEEARFFLAAHLGRQMHQFRQEQFIHREFYRLGRTRQRENQCRVADARDRP